MALCVRFERRGQTGFGTLQGEVIRVHGGGLFALPPVTGEASISEVHWGTPVQPRKSIGPVSDFRSPAANQQVAMPAERAWSLSACSAHLHPRGTIGLRAQNMGTAIHEGDPGIIVGLVACAVHPDDLIAWGTSVAIGVLQAGSTVEVAIDGRGTVRKTVEGSGRAP